MSWTGSYYLIATSLESFAQNSVSMLIENVRTQDVTSFPSIGICEMGYAKQQYEALEKIIRDLKPNEDASYNYDVEDFMLRIIFHNLYNYGSITSYCAPYRDCTDCIKCPENQYQMYAEKVRTNCENLLQKCTWNGKDFNCCQHFKPLKTTLGICFLLNSIQAEQNIDSRLDMTVDWRNGPGHLEIEMTKATAV